MSTATLTCPATRTDSLPMSFIETSVNIFNRAVRPFFWANTLAFTLWFDDDSQVLKLAVLYFSESDDVDGDGFDSGSGLKRGIISFASDGISVENFDDGVLISGVDSRYQPMYNDMDGMLRSLRSHVAKLVADLTEFSSRDSEFSVIDYLVFRASDMYSVSFESFNWTAGNSSILLFDFADKRLRDGDLMTSKGVGEVSNRLLGL